MSEEEQTDKPRIVFEFAADRGADATIHIDAGINEIQLFGASEMLKQFAYELMARRAMERQMEEAVKNPDAAKDLIRVQDIPQALKGH